MCLPDFYLLKFLIFILHVGSLTFKILADISALFYFCGITLLALGIILCFYCLFVTFEYHFVGPVSFSRESSHIYIKTFSLTYFFARTLNIFFVESVYINQKHPVLPTNYFNASNYLGFSRD